MIRSWLKHFRGLFTQKTQPIEPESVQESLEDFSSPGHSFTVADLNLEAARRQAAIGTSYARHKKTAERLAELHQGTVTLPPHKSWTGDYTDWTADPFKDLNWRFQYHTLRWINPYLWDAYDGNEDSKAEWKRIVHSWGAANVPPERAEDKYAWMDMTDGNRAIQTSLGAPLMNSEDQWYVNLLVTHRNWLMDDANIVAGNHGLHQNLGLFVVSVVLNDKIGTIRSIERLGTQILEVFDEKGMNEEGSVAYHQSNVSWWLQAQQRLKLEGYDFSAQAVQRLETAGEALAYLILPDGSLPQVGDGGRGRGRRGLHPLLDKVLKRDIGDAELPLFHHFPNGFTVLRSGWGEDRPFEKESHTIVRHGRDLRRHSHNDRGSVHLYTKGLRWITDGGFHSYQQRNKHRNYTKSRAAHSIVQLPDQKHDKTGNVPVKLLQDLPDLHAIEILDDNFETAQWRRRVIYSPGLDLWVIWDRVVVTEPEPICQQWLVDVGIDVREHNDSTVILEKDSNELAMCWFGDVPNFDIVTGDQSSGSMRGLIGIGWKKMRKGTSLHSNFNGDQLDSIVVIASKSGENPRCTLSQRVRMKSFVLQIDDGSDRYHLEVDTDTTRLTQRV